MWSWVENTPPALFVAESVLAYPIILSCHAVGLATAVGIFLLRDAHLLGVFGSLDPGVFLRIGKLAWIGFILNAVSGTLLFIAQADTLVQSTPFLLKIGMIFTAIVMALLIEGNLRKLHASGSHIVNPVTKSLAAASILLWTGALVSGRLIAYV